MAQAGLLGPQGGVSKHVSGNVKGVGSLHDRCRFREVHLLVDAHHVGEGWGGVLLWAIEDVHMLEDPGRRVVERFAE